jgi:L-iditol 2-dehydrogenase
MKAARLHGARDLRMHDEPAPTPSVGQALVHITAAGICGSDLHWYAEGGIGTASLTRPLVLGHEFCGVIESGKRRGQRVVIEPSDGCGQCEQCHAGHPNLCQHGLFAGYGLTDGAFREYIAWPEHLLIPIPDSISDAEGAMLEPFCNGLQAIDLGHVHAGMFVSICGCGPIGLVVLQAAKAAGATTILMTEKRPHRIEAARRLGATDVFVADGTETKAIMKATGGRGVDVAFECAGHNDALAVCMNVARSGGRVVIVGIPIDENTTFNASVARAKGLSIMMQRRSHPTYAQGMRLVQAGLANIRDIVSHEFPLADTVKAFEFAEKRKGLKIVIKP